MQNLSALVVDDSKVGRLTMLKKLESLGIQVQMAESGQEALGCLEQTRPDLIFMDHMMPDMDGFETTRRIKASPASRHIPVIVISGNEGPEFIRQAREAGAVDAIVKPPATEVLEQLIASLSAPAAAPPAPDRAALERLRSELLAEMDLRRDRHLEAMANLEHRLTDLEDRIQSFDQRLLDLEAAAGRPAADLAALRAEMNEGQARSADPKPLLEEMRQSLMTLVVDHAGLTAARNNAFDLRLANINSELTRIAQDLHVHGAALAKLQDAARPEQDQAAAEIPELREALRQLEERWSEPQLREMVVDTIKHLKSAKQAQAARDAHEAREAQEAEPSAAAATPRRNSMLLLAGAGLLAAAGLILLVR